MYYLVLIKDYNGVMSEDLLTQHSFSDAKLGYGTVKVKISEHKKFSDLCMEKGIKIIGEYDV